MVAQEARSESPRSSRLMAELLDSNHDAWRVFRCQSAWTFYREVGDGGGALPLGAVVMKTAPGQSQSIHFHSAHGSRSLIHSYGDEVPRAIQLLIDRERLISLFTRASFDSDPRMWDHSLSFSGTEVSERRVSLRGDAPLFERLVGNARSRISGFAGTRGQSSSSAVAPGIAVFEHDGQPPTVECSIIYPRPINLIFHSSRLRIGLNALTNGMVSLVVEHNRSVERRVTGADWDFGY